MKYIIVSHSIDVNYLYLNFIMVNIQIDRDREPVIEKDGKFHTREIQGQGDKVTRINFV